MVNIQEIAVTRENMDIPVARWYLMIERRCSRRKYQEIQVEPDLIHKMNYTCKKFRPFPSARAELVPKLPETIFRGIVGSYGKVKGAPAFIAFIGDMNYPYVQEQVGYTGEGIVLEAEALGLGTCWVGGYFRPDAVAEVVQLKKSEKVLCVTPLGYPTKRKSFEERLISGFGITHRRKKLSSLVQGLDEKEWAEAVQKALEAARLSPSAINRQPWQFTIEPDSLLVSTRGNTPEFSISKRLDCGIAMLHMETALRHHGIEGKWKFLRDKTDVARFIYRKPRATKAKEKAQ